MDEYVPLGVREGDIDPGVLVEGVPSYMRQSLTDWIGDALRDLRRSPYLGQSPEWVLSEEHLKVRSPDGTRTALVTPQTALTSDEE
jgi:hypothetical protein